MKLFMSCMNESITQKLHDGAMLHEPCHNRHANLTGAWASALCQRGRGGTGFTAALELVHAAEPVAKLPTAAALPCAAGACTGVLSAERKASAAVDPCTAAAAGAAGAGAPADADDAK